MSPLKESATRSVVTARGTLIFSVQLPLIAIFAVVAAIAAGSSDPSIFGRVVLASAVLVVVTVVAAVFVPWSELNENWPITVALVDIVLIAILREVLYVQQPRVSILVIVPVLWMSFSFRAYAVWLAVIGSYFVAFLPVVVHSAWPNTVAAWGNLLLPATIMSLVAIAVYTVALKVGRQRIELINAYENLRVAAAQGLVDDEALRISIAKGVVGATRLRESRAAGRLGRERLRVSVAENVDSAEALRVSVAEGVVGAEALRVSVAEGVDSAEALRVSVAEGEESAEALRVSVAEGVVGAEALRVSVAEGVVGAEALRVSVAEGADSAEALRVSVAEGVVGAEALRVSVAEGEESAEALRVSVAEGVVGAEALRVSVAEGVVGAEALRVSVAQEEDSAEALRVSVAAGADSAEALRLSLAAGVDSAELLRLAVAAGVDSAELLRVSVAAGVDSAAALRVSVAKGLDGEEALRVSVADGLDAASAALAVVDTVDAGITFYDTTGTIMLTNDMARALAVSSLTIGSATGSTPDSLVFGADRVTPIPAIDQIIGRAARGELVSRRAYWVGVGLEQRAIVASSQYVRRASGELIGTVVATHDVTPLATAIQSRDQFLTTISHELRTPLTSMIGYLELIEDSIDVPASGIEGEFNIVQRNSKRLLALINDLLTTAEGEAPLERRRFNVSELAGNSLNAIRAKATEKGVAIVAGDLPIVRAEVDADRIGDVLDKLLSNAVKFNERGGSVALSVAQDGDEVVIRINDTGIGISDADLPRIFERFFRSSTSRVGEVAGAGLGLSTAKVIVDAHHGTITAASVLGQGTTMELRIPLVTPAA